MNIEQIDRRIRKLFGTQGWHRRRKLEVAIFSLAGLAARGNVWRVRSIEREPYTDKFRVALEAPSGVRKRQAIKKLICILTWALWAAAAESLAQTYTQPFAATLNWADNSFDDPATPLSNEAETGFVIERAIGAGSFADLTTVPANTTQFVDTIAADTGNVKYCYRVAAENSAGRSAFTPSACITSPTIVVVVVTVVPAPPGGINVVGKAGPVNP